jgi:antitoxin (DNA-binding transcriptional repressor) of toxin-antitoxin stability system
LHEVRIAVRELNQQTAQCLARVKQGETLVVTEHGQVIALLSPPRPTGIAKLDALIAEGRARPAVGDRSAVLSQPPAHAAPRGEVSAALQSDRKSSRRARS